jgi:hypothetical protein
MPDPAPLDPMAPLCLAGTLLPTARGAVPAERLAPGDVLLSGAVRHEVRWVDRTVFAPAWLAAKPEFWPVRLAAGALDDGLPAHDATVLATQPLAVPGFAPIAAAWLAFLPGITRPAPAAMLDILALHLDPPLSEAAIAGLWGLCPRTPVPHPGEDALAALRRHLAHRAGLSAGVLRGKLDRAARDLASGWAEDGSGHPVAVELVVDGIARPPVPAARYRADLERAGIAGGHAAFHIAIDPPLDPARAHLLAVCRALDGQHVPGSPVLLPAAVAPASMVAFLPPGEARAAVEQEVQRLAARLSSSSASRPDRRSASTLDS